MKGDKRFMIALTASAVGLVEQGWTDMTGEDILDAMYQGAPYHASMLDVMAAALPSLRRRVEEEFKGDGWKIVLVSSEHFAGSRIIGGKRVVEALLPSIIEHRKRLAGIGRRAALGLHVCGANDPLALEDVNRIVDVAVGTAGRVAVEANRIGGEAGDKVRQPVLNAAKVGQLSLGE